VTLAAPDRAARPWDEENAAYLDAAVRRIRLLLRRRVLWLRRSWAQDPLWRQGAIVVSDARADELLDEEDPGAEARFHGEDPEAAALSRAIEELRLGPAQDGRLPALEVVARLFGLTNFERDTLLLCVGPELDPGLAPLYAYVQDDASRPFATPHLAMTLLGESEGAERSRFLPGAPLRRFRLLEVDAEDGPPGSRSLRLDDRVIDYLLGTNRPDERMATLLRPVPPAPLSPPHLALVERLHRRLGARPGPWPVLNLLGAPATGVRTSSQALCAAAGLELGRIETSRLPEPGPALDQLISLLARESVLLRLAFLVDVRGTDPAPATHELIARLEAPLIVAGERPWPVERDILVTDVPPLGPEDKAAMWRRALEAHPDAADGIEAIVAQFDPGPAAVVRTLRLAGSRLEGEGVLSPEQLWDACREVGMAELRDLALGVEPRYGWDDIVLPEDELRQLREISDQVANRAAVYEAWGFGRGLGRGRGISALFSGPSGTGKTMAAEVLAKHLRLDLYRVDLAGVVSKYIGETEKNLRRVFDAAELGGAILFFDEADALFGKRSEVRDSHDRYANIEIDYLLQRMETYRGLAILATNRRSLLDPAFLRRLRFLVEFPFPHAELRLRIWELAFPPEAPTDGLDLAALSRLEIAGANIKNIALAAGFLAAAEGVPIGMAHVLHAARREFAKIDRLLPEPVLGGGA
jgi:hypothetical protein